MRKILFFLLLLAEIKLCAQTQIHINPANPINIVSSDLSPGVFFVPKNATGFNAFFDSNTHFKAVRLNIIESALNNSSNLTQCLALLEQSRTDVLATNQRCDHLVLIFEKMPAWLSSSSDPSPAQTPGWSVLNTKPPANWTTWQTVVDSIVNKINNQWGLDPYYEVWNEPDIGSWTGTEAEYMRLFRTTRTGAKNADPTAKVGGPAVNYWANGLARTFIPERIHPDTFATHSLIAHLIDSMLITQTMPDFISWHNFTFAYSDFHQPPVTVNSFFASRSVAPLPVILSEWNAPSAVRDQPAGFAFVNYVNQSPSLTSDYDFDCIAAWQDFNPSATEFHQDYGLISYGGLEKPVWKMLHTMDKYSNSNSYIAFQNNGTGNLNNLYWISGDTIRLMLTNRNSPGIAAAFEHLVYNGCTSVRQLDNDGYINLQTGDVSRLDSALRNLIPISGALPSDNCILNAQSLYAIQDSLWTHSTNIDLSIYYLQGNTPAKIYRIDSTHNNIIYRYDSLRNAGYTQANAISYLLPLQQLQSENISLTNGSYQFSMQPNSFVMIEVPGVITGISENTTSEMFSVYPNPAHEFVTINSPDIIECWQLHNSAGQLIDSGTQLRISTEALSNGLYILSMQTASGLHQKHITVQH
jgi:Glycosyl hydrolases family 39/Secretion system C-terminal sorting domain